MTLNKDFSRILGLDERVVAHLGIPPPWLLSRRSAPRVGHWWPDGAARVAPPPRPHLADASTQTPARGSGDDKDVLDFVIVVEHPET